jgi:hypothetical protein
MGLLQRIFRSNYGRRIEHPVLGEALLVRAKKGAYWEVETEVAYKAFTVSIEAPDEADPSQEQVAFFERYAKNPNLAFLQSSTASRSGVREVGAQAFSQRLD